MEQRFVGKTVVVTGASSGIGVGIARRFVAEGANVVVAARRKEQLDQVAAMLGSRAFAVRADVSSEKDVEALIGAGAERFGGIDVLVSNAGIGLARPFDDTTTDDWRRVMSTDLDGCFYGARAALPYLKQSRGSIVHIASASGLGGGPRAGGLQRGQGCGGQLLPWARL